MSSLGVSSQLLTAYERQSLRGAELVRRYTGDEAVMEEFLNVVRNHFFLGVHASYVHTVLKVLLKKLGSQQAVAEALGLKDRTSISKMLSSELMDGVRLTAALHQFGDIIEWPPRGLRTLYGFSRATSFIKARALGDASIEGTLGAQNFSYTVGMLASPEWDTAVRHPDPEVGRRVAEQIMRERKIDVPWPPGRRRQRKLRPEQYVNRLLRLLEEWGIFAVMALTAIPDCIPAEEDGEATL